MRTRRGAIAAGGAMVACLWLLLAPVASAAIPAAGPPYPDPVTGQRVYDYAGIFGAETIASAETTIAGIEARTGAQVAVYTQVKPASDTLDAANADALALMNQWGVGRKGFDDGLVILFDMEANLRHGQVSLYAGSGFKAAFLSNSERQSIFDNDMKPLLASGDLDGGLLAGLARIDQNATPAHADALNQARILNAIVGFGALALGLGLAIFAVLRWYTHGRDPDYLDDDSILMPAPPPDLTPAMATLLINDRTSGRTVSAAMVDLAARGRIAFHEAGKRKTSLQVNPDDSWLPGPEGDLDRAIRSTAGPDGLVEAAQMHDLASAVGSLKSDLEKLAVDRKWLTGRPSRVVGTWFIVAVVEAVAAYPLISWTLDVGASGGLLGGAGLIGAAVVTAVVAWFMPCRTKTGAMLTAMLAAYRRTLRYTMAMASSMEQVAASRAVPWIDTPDKAMAWGVAFGLNDEIDGVLKRSLAEDSVSPDRRHWYPGWWVSSGSGGGGGGFGGGGGGLYSASAIPNVGSMMAAIGSIGASTSHSGGGGFGGGGGGGGGGAGGGF